MKKLLLFVLLATPLGCSRTPSPATPKSTSYCLIPKTTPPPRISTGDCDDKVCMSMEDAVALARWIHQIKELQVALSECSLVTAE